MPRGLAARVAGFVLLAGLGASLVGRGAATAQDLPAESARIQRHADALRLPLLAPAAATGFSLESIRVRRQTCGGEFLAELYADYLRADGARISFLQAFPRPCGDFGEVDEDGTTIVRGRKATYLWAGGGSDCFEGPEAAPCSPDDTVAYADSLALTWSETGERIAFYALFSNLIAKAPIETFAASLIEFQPGAGRAPLWLREQARVLTVLRPDRVRVLVGGRRRVVTLAGIRAPRSCKRGAALTAARLIMPRGRMVTLETDPTRGGARARVFIYRSALRYSSYDTVNGRLVSAGLARVVGQSRFRRSLLASQKQARSDKKGVFSSDCTGPPPTHGGGGGSSGGGGGAAPPPPAPVPGNIYNCDDFPLPDGTTAQDYLKRYPSDPSGLDGNNDGVACE